MFGWRRRSEGFEWREYVRTTVLVRRADRQRKIDDARMAALAKVKDTKDRGVAAGRATASALSSRIAELAMAAAGYIWSAIVSLAVLLWGAIVALVSAVLKRLPSMPQLPAGVSSRALDGVKNVGRMMPDVGFRLPFNPQWLAGGAAALALIFIGGPMLSSGQSVSVAHFSPASSTSSAVSATDQLSGPAYAVTGDLLRIDGQLVKLSGIETPEAKHPCAKSNGRRWNCSASARSALEKIVRGKPVKCVPSGEDSDGHMLAACHIDNVDIAAELVRGGHVFAGSGFFASYSTAENEARDAKVGVWQGDTVRPKEWREQIWEEAKRAAPEGCPIKGVTRASNRIYSMPWSSDYDGAKVRTVKGDRWFCSEDEARAAGFVSSSRS